ncbi:ATP-binding protein [Streptomyces sp. NPDC005805]|uniref:ATP-binding protein n=1 Tax=Streptomyces sp. NPDC005805 TaxID=3157068 RepID=UPI00340E78A3
MTTTPPPAPGRTQTRRLALFGTRGVVSRCRDFTHEALDDWGWPRDGAAPLGGEGAEVSEDVLLLVSEIVTNACLHAGGPLELVLRRDGARLRIEVADASAELPRRQRRASPSVPGGHGLIVMERLARRWGAERRGDGKVVWAEVVLPPG